MTLSTEVRETIRAAADYLDTAMPSNTRAHGIAQRLGRVLLLDGQGVETMPTEEQGQEAFREGMAAGLDFAYRVVDDLRAEMERSDQATTGLTAIRVVQERLVSEHDMRSEQPINRIREERATQQAADAVLADIIRESNTLNRGVDPLTAFRARHPRGVVCNDLSCPCTPPAPDPGPMRVPAGAGEMLNNCGCGRNPGLESGEVRENNGDGTVTVHVGNLPCYVENEFDRWVEAAEEFTIPRMDLNTEES